MISRGLVVAAARGWLGVPFRHQGRTRDGIDCGGLAIRIASELGLSSFDVSGYRRLPAGAGGITIEGICEREMCRVGVRELAPGDVALFLVGRRPRHLAVLGDYYAGGLSMIHAYEPAGRVVETRFDASWRASLFEAYALPGVS